MNLNDQIDDIKDKRDLNKYLNLLLFFILICNIIKIEKNKYF